MTTATEVKVLKAHLALNVRDVKRSIEFYRKMLGIEPSKVRTGYAKFDVQNPPLNLTLNQHAFNEQGALSHLGLQVASTEDVLAVRERWAEARPLRVGSDGRRAQEPHAPVPLQADDADHPPRRLACHQETFKVLLHAFAREVRRREQRQEFGQVGARGPGETNVFQHHHHLTA